MLVDFARRIPSLDNQLRNLWADHGDAVSMHYAGTGALKSGFTRTGKRTLMGFLDDGWKSAVRYYKNNFVDGQRQDIIDLVVANTPKEWPLPHAGPSTNEGAWWTDKGAASWSTSPNYGQGRSPMLPALVGMLLLLYGLCNGLVFVVVLVSTAISAVLTKLGMRPKAGSTESR